MSDASLTPEREAEIRSTRAESSGGRWFWTGNTAYQRIFLARRVAGLGLVSVMDFKRWGMQGAQPRFLTDGWLMRPANDLAVWEVNRKATDPNDPSLYRHDIVGIRCPVPILREDVPALVAFARAVLDAADDAADDADVPPRGALPPWRAVGTKTIRAYAAIYLRGES